RPHSADPAARFEGILRRSRDERGICVGRCGGAGSRLMTSERRLPDGRVEWTETRGIEASPLYNHDLAPVPVSRRNWSTYNYAALWISMAHCIPTYMLASGLMATGMNWWQALITILLGNVIVL